MSMLLQKINTLVTGKINFITDRLLGHFPEEKRRPVLYIFGALIFIFLILCVTALAVNLRGPKKNVTPDMAVGPAIPAEDLFFPSEPDFLPAFILEREPRFSWSIEDIRPYWRNPEHTEKWREEIKSAVDKLMEGVP